MRKMHALLFEAVLGIAMAIGGSRPAAAEGCLEFSWDVRAEHALFAMRPQMLTAGIDRATAPLVSPDHLYQFALNPQDQVAFPTPPGGRPPAAPSFGGLARFRLSVAGAYRISVDQPLWIDVAFNGALLKPQDFEGRKGCTAPHKIVEFVLPRDVDLVVQLSGAATAAAKLTITPSPPQAR